VQLQFVQGVFFLEVLQLYTTCFGTIPVPSSGALWQNLSIWVVIAMSYILSEISINIYDIAIMTHIGRICHRRTWGWHRNSAEHVVYNCDTYKKTPWIKWSFAVQPFIVPIILLSMHNAMAHFKIINTVLLLCWISICEFELHLWMKYCFPKFCLVKSWCILWSRKYGMSEEPKFRIGPFVCVFQIHY
jgi:hypothetical protein